ncbi:MAG: hypothetical protein U0K60_03170 [Parafannyhessea umbonata]|nr:hypothetical protein [Parafannyhessea umbonata]
MSSFTEGIYIAGITRSRRDPYSGAEHVSTAGELFLAIEPDDLAGDYITAPRFVCETGTTTRVIYDHNEHTAYVTADAYLADDALQILGPQEVLYTDDDGRPVTWSDVFADVDNGSVYDVLGNLDMPIVTVDFDMHQTRGVEHVEVLHI